MGVGSTLGFAVDEYSARCVLSQFNSVSFCLNVCCFLWPHCQ